MIALLHAIDRVVVGAALAGSMALLAAMACITFWQVLTRFVLDDPSTWSEVSARSLMIWMVYLGLCVVMRSGSLIAIDLALGLLPAAGRRLLVLVIGFIGLAVLIVMVRFGWAMADRAAAQTIAGLQNPFTGGSVSIAWVYAAIPVGASLSIVALFARLAEDLVAGAAPVAHDP